MPIDFPNSPTAGDVFTVGGVRWQYDGTAWSVIEGDATQVVDTKTDSYTLVTSDGGKIIQMDKSTATTITVSSALDLAVGDRVDIIGIGTGTVTVQSAAAPANVTLNGVPSLQLRARWSAASLICVGADSYVLVGDLSGSTVAQDGYFAVNLTGGWNAGNPTNSTSGTSFTVPTSGVYLTTLSCGCYTGTAGLMTIGAHLNGSATASISQSHFFNVTNTHLAFASKAAILNLTSGTNYVWLKQSGTGVNSDGNDFAMFTGIKVGA